MKALYTNILIRLLVNDDLRQAAKVKDLFIRAEQSKEKFKVTTLVVLEIIWVLKAVYNCTRKEIVDALEKMLPLAAIDFEHSDVVRELCQLSRTEKTELSDLFIGLAGKHSGCELTLTFDKQAVKSSLFNKIS